PVTESERSVARGPAAPGSAGATNGDATAVMGADETAVMADERPRVFHGRRRARPVAAGVALFLGLVALGLVAGQIFGDPAGSAARTGPLSEDEVRDAAQTFADAYAAEDPAALGRSVTRDVVRVLPGGRSQGRAQIVDQYERQFDGKVLGYELEDLEVTGGRAGRASGSYRVDREGRDTYEGTIVFGVVRERGIPRIELIAATPSS
ncbi:MAG: DUF4440 domain-containing protein, partial [Solirubrobacteraceae bacterium]